MTQEELGELIGVTGVTIMRYEKGQREPRMDQLQKIGDVLGINWTYLVGSPVGGGTLEEAATIRKIPIVQREGNRDVRREPLFYNLDAIISVGYRVNSCRATRFRIWATGVLKEYMIKGFAMDDERLKQGKTAFGTDYFRELLERVRSIRASERRIWQQVTDIFAECSMVCRFFERLRCSVYGDHRPRSDRETTPFSVSGRK